MKYVLHGLLDYQLVNQSQDLLEWNTYTVFLIHIVIQVSGEKSCSVYVALKENLKQT